MRLGEAYMKKEESEYAEQVRQRQEKQFFRRAAELGFEVKRIEPLAVEAGAVDEPVTPEESAAVLAALETEVMEAEASEVWEAESLGE